MPIYQSLALQRPHKPGELCDLMLGTRLQGAAGPMVKKHHLQWHAVFTGKVNHVLHEPESADGEETCWNVAVGLQGIFFFFTLYKEKTDNGKINYCLHFAVGC